jgi:hypothetical protein
MMLESISLHNHHLLLGFVFSDAASLRLGQNTFSIVVLYRNRRK